MMKAAIDLGTNTCLLLVVKTAQGPSSQKEEVLIDLSRVVRLGEGVDQSRLFQPAAMQRVLGALQEYRKQVESFGLKPEQVVCVATSQARDARNSKEFFDQIRNDLGFQFQTISGAEEARLTFLGALLPGMDPQSSVVLDIGGGSTELISTRGEQSLDLGSVRFTERFFPAYAKAGAPEGPSQPVSDEEFWTCQDAIDQVLEGFRGLRAQFPENAPLVGVAGTVTTLAAWYLELDQFDSQKVDGTILTRGDVHRMVEELKWRNGKERRALPCMEPLRADVILAGALILWRMMEILKFPAITVSTRGLRYGVMRGLSGKSF